MPSGSLGTASEDAQELQLLVSEGQLDCQLQRDTGPEASWTRPAVVLANKAEGDQAFLQVCCRICSSSASRELLLPRRGPVVGQQARAPGRQSEPKTSVQKTGTSTVHSLLRR